MAGKPGKSGRPREDRVMIGISMDSETAQALREYAEAHQWSIARAAGNLIKERLAKFT